MTLGATGRAWETVQVSATATYFGLYVVGTFNPPRAMDGEEIVRLACVLLFVADMLLRVYHTPGSRVKTSLRWPTLLDAVIVIPFLAQLRQPVPVDFGFLSFARLVRILDLLKNAGVLKEVALNPIKRKATVLAFTLSTLVVLASGVTMLVENDLFTAQLRHCLHVVGGNATCNPAGTSEGDPGFVAPDACDCAPGCGAAHTRFGDSVVRCAHFDFFRALYFIVVTISTVGYGDVHPVSVAGRAVLIVLIAAALVVIPMQVNELTELLSMQSKYRTAYRKRDDEVLVLIVGHVASATMLMRFFEEFFHPDRAQIGGGGREEDPDEAAIHQLSLRAVILSPQEPDEEIRSMLLRPELFDRVSYVLGSVLSAQDLARAGASEARACFVLSKKQASNVMQEDAANIMRALAVKDFNEDIDMYVQIMHPSNKAALMEAEVDVLLCVEEMKMTLLSQSCLAPGIFTLIHNIFASLNTHPARSSPLWRHEYAEGCSLEAYVVPLPSALIDLFSGSFHLLADGVFEEFGLLCIGVQRSSSDKDVAVILNPNEAFALCVGDSIILLADDYESADAVFQSVGSAARVDSMRRHLASLLGSTQFRPLVETLRTNAPEAVRERLNSGQEGERRAWAASGPSVSPTGPIWGDGTSNSVTAAAASPGASKLASQAMAQVRHEQQRRQRGQHAGGEDRWDVERGRFEAFASSALMPAPVTAPVTAPAPAVGSGGPSQATGAHALGETGRGEEESRAEQEEQGRQELEQEQEEPGQEREKEDKGGEEDKEGKEEEVPWVRTGSGILPEDVGVAFAGDDTMHAPRRSPPAVATSAAAEAGLSRELHTYSGHGHIVVVGTQENMHLFVEPLRSQVLVGTHMYRPIVILHPKPLHECASWSTLRLLDDVYFIRGSPLSGTDLRRAGTRRAKRVVLLTDRRSTIEIEGHEMDASVIITYLALEKHVPPRLFSVVEMAGGVDLRVLNNKTLRRVQKNAATHSYRYEDVASFAARERSGNMSRRRIAGTRAPGGDTTLSGSGIRRRHGAEESSPGSDSPHRSWTGRLMSSAREAVYGVAGASGPQSAGADADRGEVGQGRGADGAAYYDMPLFAAGAAVMADHFCDSLLCQSFFALQVMHICDQLLHAPNDEVVLNHRAVGFTGADSTHSLALDRTRPMSVTPRAPPRVSDAGAVGEANRAAQEAELGAQAAPPGVHEHGSGHGEAERPPMHALRQAHSVGARGGRSTREDVLRASTTRQYSSRSRSIGGKALHGDKGVAAQGDAGFAPRNTAPSPTPTPATSEHKQDQGGRSSPSGRHRTVRAAWAAAVFADAGHRWRTRNRGQLHQIPIPENFSGRRFRDFFRHMLLSRQVIVIGLYRAPTANNGASLPYVYTAPNGTVILHPEDIAFVLAAIDQLPELHAGWDPEAARGDAGETGRNAATSSGHGDEDTEGRA